MFGRKKEKEQPKIVYDYGTTKGKHILDIAQKDKGKFLNSFDYIMTDCEGVMSKYHIPISDAGTAVMLLKSADKQVKFVIGDSSMTEEELINLLKMSGVTDVKNSDLVYPVKSMAQYLNRRKLGQPVFSLCNHNSNEYLKKAGLKVITMKPTTSLQPDNIYEFLRPRDRVIAVALDTNINLTYGELAKAQQYLLDEKCALVVGATDTFFRLTKDVTTIGNGGFVSMLRESSKKEPIILCKPGLWLKDELVQQFRLTNMQRVLFVGGSIINDIQFAINCGFQSMLVMTGTATLKEFQALPDELKPDYIADGLADFVKFFENIQIV